MADDTMDVVSKVSTVFSPARDGEQQISQRFVPGQVTAVPKDRAAWLLKSGKVRKALKKDYPKTEGTEEE